MFFCNFELNNIYFCVLKRFNAFVCFTLTAVDIHINSHTDRKYKTLINLDDSL